MNDTTIEDRAAALADECANFQVKLRDARIASGLSAADVGTRIGVSASKVEEFEAYWYEPTMAEIRRYALAIGVGMELRVVSPHLS